MQAMIEPIYETHKGWLEIRKVPKHGRATCPSYKICKTCRRATWSSGLLLSNSQKEDTILVNDPFID